MAVVSGPVGTMPRMAGLREKVKRHPPNLRRGNAKQRCAICRHYDGKGGCMKFGWRVRPAELCDDFAPAARKEA